MFVGELSDLSLCLCFSETDDQPYQRKFKDHQHRMNRLLPLPMLADLLEEVVFSGGD
jgi:hypothetical protein